MSAPDPETATWTIYWTIRKALRSWIKPKDEHRPAVVADQVVADLRQSNWHLIKGPANSGWDFDPAAIKHRQEGQREFDEKLKDLKDHVRKLTRSSPPEKE